MSHRRRLWKGSLGMLLAAAALAPAALAPLRAMAQEEGGDEEAPDPTAPAPGAPKSAAQSEQKKRVIGKLPVDPTILINVTAREMPASPDVLNLGRRSTRALERCLADNVDAGIRSECAVMLAALGDASALPTLQTALDDWEPSVRFQVIRALTRIPSESSFEPLMKLYRRGDETPGNAGAILGALGAMSSQKAVRVLRTELRHPSQAGDVHVRAFKALWMSRHLMDRRTLAEDVAFALGSENRGVVLEATEASAELREASLVAPLTKLIEDPSAEIRNKAVYALGRIGDPRAARVLLAQLPKVREARMLNNIAFALERLDPKAFFPAVERLIQHKQAVIRLNAAFVLGDVRRPEGRPILEKSLADANDYVKTSSIAALGKLALPETAAELERFASDVNPAVRQEAIYALHSLSGNKKNELIYSKLFQSSWPKVKDRAAIVLALSGDTRVREHVLACFEQERCALGKLESYFLRDKHPSVRERLLVGWTRGTDGLTDVVGKLRPGGASSIATATAEAAMAVDDHSLAEHAFDLAGDLGDSAVRERLRAFQNTTDARLRAHVVVALARLGATNADSQLLSDLEQLPAEWLPEYSRTLARVAEPDVRKRLAAGLGSIARDKRVELALAAAAVLLAWDPDQYVFLFLDALSAKTTLERERAASYLRRELRSARGTRLTWLLRRALARENRPYTRDRLRMLLDGKK